MSQATTSTAEADQIAAARDGDEAAFERLASAYRSGLHAHCYRMLGSVQDADDALQETLLAAWRGLPGFEGRSSLRSWLYRIATHACLRLAADPPPRRPAAGAGPAPPGADPGLLPAPYRHLRAGRAGDRTGLARALSRPHRRPRHRSRSPLRRTRERGAGLGGGAAAPAAASARGADPARGAPVLRRR